MSSTWLQNNEKLSSIKNEHTNDDEQSNHSNSSTTTSSPINNQQQHHQTAMIDAMYSESATLKNLNMMSGNNLSQEHGRIEKREKKNVCLFLNFIIKIRISSIYSIRSSGIYRSNCLLW